jgi:hypothetical protein
MPSDNGMCCFIRVRNEEILPLEPGFSAIFSSIDGTRFAPDEGFLPAISTVLVVKTSELGVETNLGAGSADFRVKITIAVALHGKT